jgi:hypothetical protein
MQIQQLAAMQVAGPDKGLNAGLTDCAAIQSPSSLSATRKLSPRHSSTPYDELEPRLKLKCGGLVMYSGGLRRQETTQRRCQAS